MIRICLLALCLAVAVPATPAAWAQPMVTEVRIGEHETFPTAILWTASHEDLGRTIFGELAVVCATCLETNETFASLAQVPKRRMPRKQPDRYPLGTSGTLALANLFERLDLAQVPSSYLLTAILRGQVSNRVRCRLVDVGRSWPLRHPHLGEDGTAVVDGVWIVRVGGRSTEADGEAVGILSLGIELDAGEEKVGAGDTVESDLLTLRHRIAGESDILDLATPDEVDQPVFFDQR